MLLFAICDFQFAISKSIAAVGLLVFLCGMLARADEGLHADVLPPGGRFRSNAPTPLDVRLDWKGPGIVEGALEITLLDLGDPVLQQRTPPLALVSGAKNLRVMLPPGTKSFYVNEAEVALKFVSKDRTYNLGRFPVPVSGDGQRRFVIAIGRDAIQGERRRSSVWQSLRLERFAPVEKMHGGISLGTSPAYLNTEDFPTEPLAFCAYDIVLIEGDAFRRLREKQLSALSRWTGAGGSLCIVTGDSQKEPQATFLREMASDDADVASAVSDGTPPGPAGRMPPLQKSALQRYGLGRVAFLAHLPEATADLDSPAWRRMAVFLWKMRADEARRCVETGEWSSSFETARHGAGHRGGQSLNISAWLQALLPRGFRPLPYLVIGAVLAAFLAIIGPLDYLALGRLRSRRWTWAVFPCVCVSFTALLLNMANDYMGSNDRQATVRLVDVGRGGCMLRSTALEMMMPARAREFTIEAKHAWITNFVFTENRGGEIPHFEGQGPERFVLHDPLRQWTPSLYRTTSFESFPENSGILWDAFDPSLFTSKPAANKYGVLHGPGMAENTRRMGGATGFNFLYIHPMQIVTADKEQKNKIKPKPATPPSDAPKHPTALFFSRTIGFDPLSQLLAQRSPSGGQAVEDLDLEDSSDPRQWIAIAWKLTGSDLQIFRRVYFTPE